MVLETELNPTNNAISLERLPAVKNNHVLQVDSTLWMAHGIIAKERAMKDLYDAWEKYQIPMLFSRNSGILCTVSVKYQKTGCHILS